MPKNKVNDPITDQEIVFARLILSGKMSDQEAAEVAGLDLTTAAYTKAKPRVQAWMREHRAATQKLLIEQQAEELRRKSAVRERVLARLWEIADLSYELTKGSNASQMRALAMIVALEGLLPDRRLASKDKSHSPAPSPQVYQSEWLRKQNSANQSGSGIEDEQESARVVLQVEHPLQTPDPSGQPSPNSDPGDSIVPHTVTFAEENSSPYTSFVPDTRGSFQLPKNPFTRWRR